jgi:hypothetical protein
MGEKTLKSGTKRPTRNKTATRRTYFDGTACAYPPENSDQRERTWGNTESNSKDGAKGATAWTASP